MSKDKEKRKAKVAMVNKPKNKSNKSKNKIAKQKDPIISAVENNIIDGKITEQSYSKSNNFDKSNNSNKNTYDNNIDNDEKDSKNGASKNSTKNKVKKNKIKIDKRFSKRLRKAKELITKPKDLYSLNEALDVLNKYRAFKAKFDESIEIVMKLGVDPKQSDQMIRGSVPMPSGLGKSIKIAVFASSEKHKNAKDAGADIVGAEDLIEQVRSGKIDFDICVTTPDMMPKMASLGKILGPKGLMPNPKLGTVSEDVVAAVKRIKSGQVEYKVEKAGLIHASVGKLSFNDKALRANIEALYSAIAASKPAAVKGVFIQKIYISTSQGLSMRLDLANIENPNIVDNVDENANK